MFVSSLKRIFAMSKERLKKKENIGEPKSPISGIMGIAERLRSGNMIEDKVAPQETVPVQTESNEIVQQFGEEPTSESNFGDFLNQVRSKKYDFTSQPIKIDVEVKEVFTLIKGNTKIPISALVSYILEEWIREHEDDIKALLTSKKNRFL